MNTESYGMQDGPGSTGAPPVPSGDSPDGTDTSFVSIKAPATKPPTSQSPVRTPPAEFNETKALLAELAAETAALKAAAGGSIIELLADWVAQQYLLATRQELAAQPPGPERVKLLRQAMGDAAALQRGGRWAVRLKLDREKLAWEQQKYQDALAAQKEARKRPDYLRPLTDEERTAILDKADEILGI